MNNTQDKSVGRQILSLFLVTSFRDEGSSKYIGFTIQRSSQLNESMRTIASLSGQRPTLLRSQSVRTTQH